MTGEMTKSDVAKEAFPLHFAIAEALNGRVEPFDVYQGPYIVVGKDIRIGRDPYAYCPTHLGVVRLWICDKDDGLCTVYNEANEKQSDEFWWDDENAAVDAALSVVAS